MIPTSRWRVVALLVASAVLATVAGCAAPAPRDTVTVGIVPAAVSTPNIVLDVDGEAREVAIRDVESTTGELVPAFVFLHGATGSIERAEVSTGFTGVAADNGFVMAYGQGTDIDREVGGGAWNAGRCCAGPVEREQDDIAYLEAVIDELVSAHGVDPARVFLGGFSNGGMLSYRASCEIGSRIAGIVVIGGAFNVTGDCGGAPPTPVLIIHGTSDRTVPYSGGEPNAVSADRIGTWVNRSVRDATTFWSARNGCTGIETVEESRDLIDERYTGCVAALELVSVLGGPHSWPTDAADGFEATSYITSWLGLSS